jgi:hypothetical protein
MQQDANLVVAEIEVVVAFSRRGTVSALAGPICGTEVFGEVEIG